MPVNIPGGSGNSLQTLGNLVDVAPTREAAIVTRYNILTAVDIYANVRGRDLGSVAKEIQALIDEAKPNLPQGSRITMRGQVQTMQIVLQLAWAFGILGAIVLVYLLIVVNFQSWLDPLIIISALPAALAGIAWILILTGTDLSVPALTGAIMTMGGGNRQQYSGYRICATAAGCRSAAIVSCAGSRCYAFASGINDRFGNDTWHDPDGDWHRRRFRAECSTRSCRDRRLTVRDRIDTCYSFLLSSPSFHQRLARRKAHRQDDGASTNTTTPASV